MGQKVNPVGLRIGINRGWQSTWIANREFATYLKEDLEIRKYLEGKYANSANIAFINIERKKDQSLLIQIHAAAPAVIKGQDEAQMKEVYTKIGKLTASKSVKIELIAVDNPDLNALIMARWIAQQLESRASFRTAQKKAMQRVMKAGAKGVKTLVAGRLGGAEIARSEGYSEGSVSLHTLRADIDFAIAEAHTTYGRLGVKVWISRGVSKPTPKVAPKSKGE